MKIIHPGSDQRLPSPPKTLLDQWKRLPIDWVSVMMAGIGFVIIWALVAQKCENKREDFLDPICVILPY